MNQVNQDLIDSQVPPTMGERATAWRIANYPETATVPLVAMKVMEELGETCRAIIANYEGREGRGDPIQEAVQTIIVLASLVHMHTGKDVFAYIEPEMQRLGA